MTRNDCARWLLAHDRYVILTHRRPDGDALGSASALCLGLRQLGKTAHLLENREATPLTGFLMEGLTCTEAGENDTVITVDMAASNMFPKDAAHLVDRCMLRIDHHDTGESYAADELVDAHASACGDIIYDLLMQMGVVLDCPMAKALYVAVSTDTGCFRYANTNAHAYQVAAACAATGADLYPLTQALFDTNSLGKLRIQGWIVDHAHIFADGCGAVCAIPKAVEEMGSKDDLEGIPGFLRSIEGVKMSATLRTSENGSKMSVRAVPGYDCTAICGPFGGGGHKGAAGASTSLPLEELEKAVIKAMKEYLEAE